MILSGANVRADLASLPQIMLIAWLVGSMPVAAPAQEPEVRELNSRRYAVVTDLALNEARELARHMDQVHDEYTRRLAGAGFTRRHHQRMKLILIARNEAYVQYLAERGVNAANTGGIFFVRGDLTGLAAWVRGRSRENLLQTLQHEGFHQFAYANIGRIPTWVNEGLAEYFGDAELVRGRFDLGRVPPRRLEQLQKAIRAGEYLPFEELLNLRGDEWLMRVNAGDPRTRLMYAQSWSIVHFLVHGGDGRYERPFMRYLRELHRGRDSASAFGAAFGSTDYQPFQEAWKQYVLNLQPGTITVAAARARFLAEGLKFLHDRDEAGGIASLDDLKSALQRIEYRHTVGSHGSTSEYRATDDENFQPPAPERGGRTPEIQLKPTDDDLPPQIRFIGYQKPIRVKWRRVEGELTFEIVYR